MALDGLFIHYLIQELKPQLINKRINKIVTINDTDFLLQINNQNNLFISINANNFHIRLTKETFQSSQTFLTNFLKKHLEKAIINDLQQHNNDRIIIFHLQAITDLGYNYPIQLIIELTGRFSNFIIVDENNYILEAAKKSFLTDERIIQTKALYKPPFSDKPNPFTCHDQFLNQYEGISRDVMAEINISGFDIVLNRKLQPTIIRGDKNHFYCFDLFHLSGQRIHFDNLSLMLEYYYKDILSFQTQSNTQKTINLYLNKELTKLNNKLKKQESELQAAYDNQDLEEKANLLAANIHLVKNYQTSITVKNFYQDNQDITIPLNPKIPKNKNIDFYFNKVKKNKRTITLLTATIAQTKQDILYYQELIDQLDYTTAFDIQEIMAEVGLKNTIRQKNKPNILKYRTPDNSLILVGKNNVQNNYLTNTLALRGDYFFHVKGYPGSHVILRGNINQDNIIIAATIAAYYSKLQNSINVNVDYTDIKWVKKIKGQKGSFVSYTNEKTVFANPSLDFIKNHTIPDK